MPCKVDFINDWELKYQGAESRLYFGIHSNNRCVIKHRFAKKYRHPVLDKKLTKERTKRERRMIEKIRERSKELADYMPKVVWSDDSTILMTEIVNCQSLFDYIEREPAIGEKVAPLVGRCVATLHNLGIIHGDLTTSNLLLVPRLENNEESTSTAMKRMKSDNLQESFIVVPIDFGLSTGSFHPEERAVDLYVLEKAILSTHYPDSTFFNAVIETYMSCIDEKTCEPLGKEKIVARLREVRARGRKSDYSNDLED